MTGDNVMSTDFDCLDSDKNPESVGESQEWNGQSTLINFCEKKVIKEALTKAKEIKLAYA